MSVLCEQLQQLQYIAEEELVITGVSTLSSVRVHAPELFSTAMAAALTAAAAVARAAAAATSLVHLLC
jgi:hypothetical protein